VLWRFSNRNRNRGFNPKQNRNRTDWWKSRTAQHYCSVCSKGIIQSITAHYRRDHSVVNDGTMWCSLSSKFFDHLLYFLLSLSRPYCWRKLTWNVWFVAKHSVRVCGRWWPNKFWRTPWPHRTHSSAVLSWYQNCCQYLYQYRQTRWFFLASACSIWMIMIFGIFLLWTDVHAAT